MEKLYIVGGLSDSQAERYRDAEHAFTGRNYDIIRRDVLSHAFPRLTKQEMLSIDFSTVDLCQAVAMIAGWKDSSTAGKILTYAKARGLIVYYI